MTSILTNTRHNGQLRLPEMWVIKPVFKLLPTHPEWNFAASSSKAGAKSTAARPIYNVAAFIMVNLPERSGVSENSARKLSPVQSRMSPRRQLAPLFLAQSAGQRPPDDLEHSHANYGEINACLVPDLHKLSTLKEEWACNKSVVPPRSSLGSAPRASARR